MTEFLKIGELDSRLFGKTMFSSVVRAPVAVSTLRAAAALCVDATAAAAPFSAATATFQVQTPLVLCVCLAVSSSCWFAVFVWFVV